MTEPDAETYNNNSNKSLDNQNKDDHLSPENIFSDPAFVDLMVLYQNSKFDQSHVLLDELITKYPGHEKLLELQKDLEIQISLRKIAHNQTQQVKKKYAVFTVRLILGGFGILILTALIFGGIFFVTKRIIDNRQSLFQQNQLTSLAGQAGQLLQSGQPEIAETIIDKIRAIDPAYVDLKNLTSEVDLLLLLSEKYNNAGKLISLDKHEEALVLLQEIDQSRSGLWDVKTQIARLQALIEIKALFTQANQAFLDQNWAKVIEAYEKALTIDPSLENPLMKEQLLNGYLRSIIQMLESDSTTSEEIEKAEMHYRKALTMIPQSRVYAHERENLQRFSSSLLELKFTQTAKELLVDPTQTVNSVAKAVSYLSKASNLNPKNAQLQVDLANARLYQVSFQYFIQMEWGPAIENLSKLIAIDSNFANGNAKILLYEAYLARGSQYYSVGLYLDARSNLENAEILAWEEPDNLLKLFQVQVMLGETIGKLRDYQNAVSYYQYATKAIKVFDRVTQHPEIAKGLYSAEGYALEGNYQEAFSIYSESLGKINQIYSEDKVKIRDGTCLAFFADAHNSTVKAILDRNNLSKSMVLTFGQELFIPFLPK
ncbi:MAG: hypothetical protein C0401_09650 [Anaerolinea sp.]|nr:hypothetical protein [Anaerolinea sp.]